MSWRAYAFLTAFLLFAVFAAWPRETIYVAEAQTQRVRLHDIASQGTEIPLSGAVLCLEAVSSGTGPLSGNDDCGDLTPFEAPVDTVLVPSPGSTAEIIRGESGPIRIDLFHPERKAPGRIEDGSGRTVDGFELSTDGVVVVLYPGSISQGRVIPFRAQAELGGTLKRQAILLNGELELQHAAALTGIRYVSHREPLRTGDTITFVDPERNPAMVLGMATFADTGQGGMRATIQGVVQGARIGRTGSENDYVVSAGSLDMLLAEPSFIALTALLGFAGIVVTLLDAAPARRPGKASARTSPNKSNAGRFWPICFTLLAVVAVAVPHAPDAHADWRQGRFIIAEREGQGILFEHFGRCFAFAPRHLFRREAGPDDELIGGGHLIPEGSGGHGIGTVLFVEMPIDGVVLEVEGMPPGGCGATLRSWQQPDGRLLLGHQSAAVRMVEKDGSVTTWDGRIRHTGPFGIDLETDGHWIFLPSMSGSFVFVEGVPVAMVDTTSDNELGHAIKVSVILPLIEAVMDGVKPTAPPPSVAAGPDLARASAGAAVTLSSGVPVSRDSMAEMLLASPGDDRRFEAVDATRSGMRVVVDLADEVSAVGCVRLDFRGVPADRRPRWAAVALSPLDDGPFLSGRHAGITSSDETWDFAFGLPQRARRMELSLGPSSGDDGVVSVRRLHVFAAQDGNGGCPLP